MLAGVRGGKPAAGSPRLAGVLWNSKTRWSRHPVAGRGESGAGVVFHGGPPWWEARSDGEGGEVKPNKEDEKCGRKDCALSDVVLRNVGGGKEGSRSVSNYSDTFFFFFFSFFLFFFVF